MTPIEALEEARRKVADKLFDARQTTIPFCRIATDLPTLHLDTVHIGFYFASLDIGKVIRFFKSTRNPTNYQFVDDIVVKSEQNWPKLTYARFEVLFAPGTTDVLFSDEDIAEDSEHPEEYSEHPELDLFHSELPQELSQWVIDQLEVIDTGDAFHHLLEHAVNAEDIKDERIRQFFQKLEDRPHCDDCQTPLRNYENAHPQYSGFGFGCPECC